MDNHVHAWSCSPEAPEMDVERTSRLDNGHLKKTVKCPFQVHRGRLILRTHDAQLIGIILVVQLPLRPSIILHYVNRDSRKQCFDMAFVSRWSSSRTTHVFEARELTLHRHLTLCFASLAVAYPFIAILASISRPIKPEHCLV